MQIVIIFYSIFRKKSLKRTGCSGQPHSKYGIILVEFICKYGTKTTHLSTAIRKENRIKQ